MGGCHLLKFHLPGVALFHPYRAEVLISRRRSLILHSRNAKHHVIGDDSHVITRLHYFHLIRHQINSTACELVEHLLPRIQLPIELHKRKVVRQRPLEKRDVPLLRRLHKAFLSIHKRLFKRTQLLSRRSHLSKQGTSNTNQQTHEYDQSIFHAASPEIEKEPKIKTVIPTGAKRKRAQWRDLAFSSQPGKAPQASHSIPPNLPRQFPPRHRNLLSARQIFQRKRIRLQFILPHDQNVLRAGLRRGLKRFLQPEPFIAQLNHQFV